MFKELLKELRAFSEKHDREAQGSRAFRIYVRCLRRHPAIAERIKAKYGPDFPRGNDLTMAASWMLQAGHHGAVDFDL